MHHQLNQRKQNELLQVPDDRKLRTEVQYQVIERDLNLIELQSFVEANFLKVVDIFIRNGNRRTMQNTSKYFFHPNVIEHTESSHWKYLTK